MKKLAIYYGFIISALMTFVGFSSANTLQELLSANLFFPIAAYFLLLILPRRKQALHIPVKTKASKSSPPKLVIRSRKYSSSTILPTFPKISKPLGQATKKTQDLKIIADNPLENIIPEDPLGIDQDRRKFIKLIGSAGISVFIMSLFTNKAQAAFFGSVPGPGSVTLKDPTTGLQISPAIRHPTDGYRINDIDESDPNYYGFTDESGAWFIMREQTSGAYRYTQGSTDYSTNWTNRASQSYNTYDVTF